MTRFKNKAVGFGQRPRPLHDRYTRTDNNFVDINIIDAVHVIAGGRFKVSIFRLLPLLLL
jgi:hypothetical protein